MESNINEKRRPTSWPMWFAGAAVLLVFYDLSVGPADRLDSAGLISPAVREVLLVFYYPLRFLHDNGPHEIRDLLLWYTRLWHP